MKITPQFRQSSSHKMKTKNQNCLEENNYQQLYQSIMATQAYEAYVEEEDKTNKDEKSPKFKYKNWKMFWQFL